MSPQHNNTFPKLHNAMWPGLVGKGSPGAEPAIDLDTMLDLTAKAQGGCLIYFSSHGAPAGVVVDQQFLPPAVLAGMVNQTCGSRPTVVIVSACFSGVFVPVLASSNRMVLTAARPDRSSFGCGEADKYPYFDQCVLETMPQAISNKQ